MKNRIKNIVRKYLKKKHNVHYIRWGTISRLKSDKYEVNGIAYSSKNIFHFELLVDEKGNVRKA